MPRYINPRRLWVGSFIPDWLERWDLPSPGAKLAYARLVRFAGENAEAWPGRQTAAEEIGVSTSQWDRYVKHLVRLRLIEVKRVGRGAANRYLFLWHDRMDATHETVDSGLLTSDDSPSADVSTLESADVSTPLKGRESDEEDQGRESEDVSGDDSDSQLLPFETHPFTLQLIDEFRGHMDPDEVDSGLALIRKSGRAKRGLTDTQVEACITKYGERSGLPAFQIFGLMVSACNGAAAREWSDPSRGVQNWLRMHFDRKASEQQPRRAGAKTSSPYSRESRFGEGG